MTNHCICTSLRQAAAMSTSYYDAALAPAGVKVTMFRLLRRIDRLERASISELADHLGLDRSTLGRNLRVLEKQALVQLSTGSDARARTVALTDTGRATLEKATPLWHHAQISFAEMIGPEMLRALETLADLTPEAKAGAQP